jgi:hypothetical protein
MPDIESLHDNVQASGPSLSAIGEVKKTSRALVDRLVSDWQELNIIIKTHDDLIRKRWRKKSRDQKRLLLLQAWGGDSIMAEFHRPDLTRHMDKTTTHSSQSLDAYKWPYMNLEDLLKPKTLLLFLNSRGRTRPHAFCSADLSACALGISTGSIEIPDFKDYSMLFSESFESYGELISKDSIDMSLETVGHCFKAGEGLLILEIQQRVWSFLVACAKEIIHHIDIDSIEQISLDSDPPSTLVDGPSIASLATSTLEAPYRIPEQFDFDRLKSIVTAKRSAVADDIWLLREDPCYFSDCVKEWKEHQPEMLLDVQGKKHPIHKAGLTKAFWNRVLRKLIADVYLSLAMWDSIYHEICQLEKLLQKYPNPSPRKSLPEDLEFAMKKVRHLLDICSSSTIALLKSHVPPSPPMRNLWHREGASSDPHSTKFRMAPNPRTEQDAPMDRLFWTYTTLWDDEQSSIVGVRTLVGELDRLTHSHTKAKELQSALVIDNIGDLGVISECLHQLSLYYPWSRTIEKDMSRNLQQLAEEFHAKITEWDDFRKMPWQGVDLADLGSPIDGRFSYPNGNRRTKSNVGALRKAEFQLDAFWYAVDKHLAAQPVALPDKMMRVLLSGNRFLQRTPEWDEPATLDDKSNGKSNGKPTGQGNGKGNGKSNGKTHGRKSSKAKNESDPKPIEKGPPVQQEPESFFLLPLSATYLQLGPSKRRESLHNPAIKTKPKDSDILTSTHPEATVNTITSTASLGAKPPMTVDKRSKKVFSTLFFSPTSNDPPPEITWLDFVHAMQAADFEPEQLYAEIWQFEHAESDAQTSVMFHAPQCVDKIPFHLVRLYGRRLARACGWDGEVFVLES